MLYFIYEADSGTGIDRARVRSLQGIQRFLAFN